MSRSPAVALAGLGTAVLLAGCFGGTVRNPPGEGAAKQGKSPDSGNESQGDNGSGEGSQQGSEQGEDRGDGDGISFAAVGDTAMGVTPILPPEPATYFDPIKGELKGDVVFGNLEGTLTDVSESPKCGKKSTECFAFRAPPEYAEYLADAGFGVMSLANNHSYDFGEAGQGETIEALRGPGSSRPG